MPSLCMAPAVPWFLQLAWRHQAGREEKVLTPCRGRQLLPHGEEKRSSPMQRDPRLRAAGGCTGIPRAASECPAGCSRGCPKLQRTGSPARRGCSKAAVAACAGSSGGGAARRRARHACCRERRALCSFPTKNPEASCVYANHNPLRGSCIYKLRHVEIKGDTI